MSKAKKNKSIERVSTFAGLSEKELNSLYGLAAIKTLKKGEYLIKEGETDQTLYVVLEGEVKITKVIQGRITEIAALHEGDWIGEIAFTRRTPRTASALAWTPARVMAINKATLNALPPETQLFFFRRMSDLANDRISQLQTREKNLSGQNQKLVDYIQSTHDRGRADYSDSELIQGIIKKIPRLPAFATELVNRIMDESISAREVAEKVKDDPSLVAMVLKTVNSSYYGFQKKVSDIHHAIVLLGFNEVYQLIMSVGMRRTMPDSPNFRALHARSMAMSHIAFSLSQASKTGKSAEMATIGLLHNIGRSVVHLLEEKNPNLALLLKALDQAQIGSLLLREWELPENLYQTVEFQRFPEFSPPAKIPKAVRTNVTLLYLSGLCLSVFQGGTGTDQPTMFLNEYKRLLGWETVSLEDIARIRLLPNLMSKLSTYPTSFRVMIKEYAQKTKT